MRLTVVSGAYQVQGVEAGSSLVTIFQQLPVKASTLQVWPCGDWVGVTLHHTHLLLSHQCVPSLLLQMVSDNHHECPTKWISCAQSTAQQNCLVLEYFAWQSQFAASWRWQWWFQYET